MVEQQRDSVFDSYSTQYRVDSKLLSNEQWELKTCNQNARKFLETHWTTLDNKLSLVGGKDFLSCVFAYFKDQYKVSLSKQKIIQAFTPTTIPQEIRQFLAQLN